MACEYTILSTPNPEVITSDKVSLTVRLVAEDGREKEFSTTISTPDRSIITEEKVYEQLNDMVCQFNAQTEEPLPTLNLTVDTPIEVIHDEG